MQKYHPAGCDKRDSSEVIPLPIRDSVKKRSELFLQFIKNNHEVTIQMLANHFGIEEKTVFVYLRGIRDEIQTVKSGKLHTYEARKK